MDRRTVLVHYHDREGAPRNNTHWFGDIRLDSEAKYNWISRMVENAFADEKCTGMILTFEDGSSVEFTVETEEDRGK